MMGKKRYYGSRKKWSKGYGLWERRKPPAKRLKPKQPIPPAKIIIRDLKTGEILKAVPKPDKRLLDYDLYMQSKSWFALRKKILNRDNRRCTRCGSKRNLEVHHLTYERFKHERLSDLTTLCRVCNVLIHKITRVADGDYQHRISA